MTLGNASPLSGGLSRKRGHWMQFIFSAMAAGWAWVYHSTPPVALTGIWVMFAFGAMDQVTGWLAAYAEGKLSSETSRRKGFAKLGTYAILIIGFWAVSLLTGYWWVFAPVVAWVCSTELMSLRENLSRMQAAGVGLGPLGPLNRALDAGGRVIGAMFPQEKGGDNAPPEVSERGSTQD